MSQAGDISDIYPEDFHSSRHRFIHEGTRLGATISSIPIQSISIGTPEPLMIDIATVGDPGSRNILLYIAGTHGVEGFVGSAIQYAILSRLREPPRDYAVVLIHCLNPWGMANIRRTNEQNIDLNRNCTVTEEERTGAPPGYEQLRSILLPHAPSTFPAFCFQALSKVLQHGYATTKQAVTGGQYLDQHGLFYGGTALQPELQLVRSWAADHLANSQRILVVDLHSGLGSFAHDTLIVDSHVHTNEYARIAHMFPEYPVHGPDPRRSIAYTTRGALSNLLPPVLPHATVDYVVHEFGTLHSFQVLYALVHENHFFFSRKEPLKNRASAPGAALLYEAFCPSSTEWRERVVHRGLKLFLAAEMALTSRGSIIPQSSLQ